MIDWLNVCILLVIFAGNIPIGFLIRHNAGRQQSGQDVLWAHGFWTAGWLFWLGAWLGIYGQWGPRFSSDLLNDLGAVCLIAFAVAFAAGRAKLKTLWIHLGLLVVIVLVYLLVVSQALNWVVPSNHTPGDLIRDDVIVSRTILFAPSLCLVIFAFGLVASAFVIRVGVWESRLMAMLAVVYALLHVPLSQVFNFVPGLRLPDWWRVVFLSWRSGFVIVYRLVVVTAAGVSPIRHFGRRWWPPPTSLSLSDMVNLGHTDVGGQEIYALDVELP